MATKDEIKQEAMALFSKFLDIVYQNGYNDGKRSVLDSFSKCHLPGENLENWKTLTGGKDDGNKDKK